MPPELAREVAITSGWRSIATQAALAARPHTHPVARPGPNAPHVRGDAADINWSALSPAAKAYIRSHAAEFGLHFPVRGEPWHIQVNPRIRVRVTVKGPAGVKTATGDDRDIDTEIKRVIVPPGYGKTSEDHDPKLDS
jgi:hypothetical protein